MDWIEWDKQHVWHPFTQAQTEGDPIPIERGEGVWLYEPSGKRYLDANSSWWVNLHGHGHPVLVGALKEQLDQLQHVIFAGVTHEPAAQLSHALLKWMPDPMEKVFFSDNGSTAVEVALKMAFQYWYNQGQDRRKVVALTGAYHGDTFGSMSVSERDVFNTPFERFLFDVWYVDPPNDENADEVLRTFAEYIETGEVSAFIFEPLVQGAAGMHMYKAEYLDQMIDLCQQHGVLTIADEVMTGFGRTGSMWAIDQLNSTVDVMCLSKGLTGGYLPMGLTVTTNPVYEVFLDEEKRRGFLHGHSYTGNPLACAVAVASLSLFGDDETWDRIRAIETSHRTFMASFSERFEHPIRCTGTILAIDIRNGAETGYFNPGRSKAYNYFKEKGLIVRPLGNTVFVNPPYCITPEELESVYRELVNFAAEIS